MSLDARLKRLERTRPSDDRAALAAHLDRLLADREVTVSTPDGIHWHPDTWAAVQAKYPAWPAGKPLPPGPPLKVYLFDTRALWEEGDR